MRVPSAWLSRPPLHCGLARGLLGNKTSLRLRRGARWAGGPIFNCLPDGAGTDHPAVTRAQTTLPSPASSLSPPAALPPNSTRASPRSEHPASHHRPTRLTLRDPVRGPASESGWASAPGTLRLTGGPDPCPFHTLALSPLRHAMAEPSAEPRGFSEPDHGAPPRGWTGSGRGVRPAGGSARGAARFPPRLRAPEDGPRRSGPRAPGRPRRVAALSAA